MTTAYIGLGANLGDPAAQLVAALDAIAAHPQIQMLSVSSLYRSAPMGPPDQPEYCNAVCKVDSGLSPQALMQALLEIERSAGRLRNSQRWGARRLDLDLLHVEGVACDQPQLHLPHPGLARRSFVLVPLAEIAPGLVIPGVGEVASLSAAIDRSGLALWQG